MKGEPSHSGGLDLALFLTPALAQVLRSGIMSISVGFLATSDAFEDFAMLIKEDQPWWGKL